MSRIPPASLRQTGGLLNYNQVATSGYYFNNHLKEAFLYDSIVRQLAKNMGVFTAAQKRKRLPILEMSVLPVYTQLRAKMCYSRSLAKSAHWFSTRLFRGARSGALCYQNASVFDRSYDSTTIDHGSKALKTTPRLKKNTYSVDTIPQILQNISNIFKLESNPKSLLRTVPIYRSRSLRPNQKCATMCQQPHLEQLYQPKIKSLSTPSVRAAKRLLQQSQLDLRGGFSFSDPTIFGVAGKKKIKSKTHQAKTGFSHVWLKRSVFSLFCLEQIIGKANACHKTTFSPSTPLPSARISNKNWRKKKFKTFYNIQLTRQLNSDQYLKIRKTYNFPRSYVDLLKPADYFVLEDRKNETSSDIEVVKASVYNRSNTHLWLGNPPREKQVTDKVKLIDFDRAMGQLKSKSNVIPKFWISRRFNASMLFNLFCVVEGQTGRSPGRGRIKHPCWLYKSLGISNSNASRWSTRLKSSFLFEFNVYSKSSNEIKSLRPITSLRF